MQILQQKRFIFKDIKVDDVSYDFTVNADDEKSAKEKLATHLKKIVQELEK